MPTDAVRSPAPADGRQGSGRAGVEPVLERDARLERELEDFIADEAALLDAGRHDEWLALFADDGRYWVPLLGARQADRHGHNSLADEDRLLLALRIERLKHPRAHSQHPRSSCQHVLQRSRREANPGDEIVMRTPFLYLEARDGEPLMLAGSYRHHLALIDGCWKIRLKRVDLLDPERPLPAIQLFI
jgi:3-phenylpropionate/cinnamic acid dioxygenase small subunit